MGYKLIYRPEFHSLFHSSSKPYICQFHKELAQLFVLEFHFTLCRSFLSPWKRRVHLKIRDVQLVNEVGIKAFGAEFQRSPVRDSNDTHTDSGSARDCYVMFPYTRVIIGTTTKQFAVEIGVVHRGAHAVTKHLPDDWVPAR